MEINYSGSGIKTLRGASYALMIVCIIATSLLILSLTIRTGLFNSEINWGMVALSVIILFNGIFALGLGLAIATIAEDSLHREQKHQLADLMEE